MKRAISAAAVVATLGAVSADPAHAGYIVSTTAEADTSGYLYKRGYNASQAFGAVGGPGFTQQLACTPPRDSGQTCAASGLGTTEATGTLRSAFESDTIASTYPPNPNFGIPMRSASGNAHASASLYTGKVGVAMGGTYGYEALQVPHGQGSADAYFRDLLHFHVRGADANTRTIIPVTFGVDGTISGVGASPDTRASLDVAFALGSGNFDAIIQDNGANAFVPTLSTYNIGGWTSEYLSPSDPGHFVFHATYTIVGSSVDAGIFARLAGSCGGALQCDYSHTAAVTFQLPTGVTFTSDSGMFLTGGSTSVPEPGAFALLGVGAIGLGVAHRRRALCLA